MAKVRRTRKKLERADVDYRRETTRIWVARIEQSLNAR